MKSKNIIRSFFLELSTDFATNPTISGEIFSVLFCGFPIFFGLPGQDFGSSFGFLEINSFFGLPTIFLFFCIIFLYK